MNRLLQTFLLTLLLASCDFTAEELYGSYAAVGYKNTTDTFTLKRGMVYSRKVYDRDNRLVLDMAGKWAIERGTVIRFDPFYLNLDDDVAKFPELVKDTDALWEGGLKSENGVTKFCVGHYQDSNCYKKIQ